MKNGWEEKKLGEVADFNRGLTYAKKDEVNYSTNVVLRANNIDLITNSLDLSELKYINENIKIPENKKVLKGSLIICTASGSKSHLGKVAPINGDCDFAFGGFMGQIRPKESIHSRFLFYNLTSPSYKDFISKLSNGVNINNLKWDDLKDFKLPLPPIPEQLRIVAILDAALAIIGTAKENAEKNLQSARELFESYLQSVFANSGEGWEEKKLGEVCNLITDGKHGDSQNEEDSGYYFLSAKDVNNGTLNYEGARQITRSDFEETHRRTDLKPGDVLVTNSGTIGRMAIAPNEDRTFKTTFQKSVAIIKPIPSIIDNVFCCYQLEADLMKLVNVSAGTAQKNLLIGDLKSHLVSFPSLPQQRAIVTTLDAISAETKKLEAIYQNKLADLEELKKSILQKAFSGELTN